LAAWPAEAPGNSPRDHQRDACKADFSALHVSFIALHYDSPRERSLVFLDV